MEELLTREEAASALGVHVNTLANMVAREELTRYIGKNDTTYYLKTEVYEKAKRKAAAEG